MEVADFVTIPLNDFLPLYEEKSCCKASVIFRHPGIIGIHSFAVDRTFFFESEDCWSDMCDLCHDLDYERTSDSHSLTCAKSRYGLESLGFVIFELGPKWKNRKKREQKLKSIKARWPYGFFEIG